MSLPTFVSAKDLMRQFNVSKATAYRWIKAMSKTIRVGQVLRVDEEEVRAFIESNTIAGLPDEAPSAKPKPPRELRPTKPRTKPISRVNPAA